MGALKKSMGPVTPVASVLFTGKLDPAKVNFVMRKFLEMAKIPSGDFRDWEAIAAWAKETAGDDETLTGCFATALIKKTGDCGVTGD